MSTLSTRVNGVLVVMRTVEDGRIESGCAIPQTSTYLSPVGQASGQTLAMIDAAFAGSENQAGEFCERFGFMEATVNALTVKSFTWGTMDIPRFSRV